MIRGKTMTSDNREAPTCAHCGAPDPGDLVLCRFCRHAVSAEAQETAIPCPQCRTANRWGRQTCVQCQGWIVVSCVFCGAISPCNQPQCLQCSEPFAGAPERKAAQERAAQHARIARSASTWGGVAASFLGAAAGGAIVTEIFEEVVVETTYVDRDDGDSFDDT